LIIESYNGQIFSTAAGCSWREFYKHTHTKNTKMATEATNFVTVSKKSAILLQTIPIFI